MAGARSGRSSELAWLVTGPLALVAVVLTAVIAASGKDSTGKWLLGLLFLLLFLWADMVRMHFEVRRQSFQASLVEIPFILGLFFLPPVTLILVRVVATSLSQVRRKMPPVKAAFNVAAAGACTVFAELVLHLFGSLSAESPRTWIALYAAGLTSHFVSMFAVTGVITIVQGRIPQRVMSSTAISGLVLALVNMTVAMVVLVLWAQSVLAVLLFGILGAGFVVAYRSYAGFLRQHNALAAIYELTRAIADTRYDGTLIDVLLARVRSLLSAEYASLWVPAQGRYPEVLLSARVESLGLIDVVVTPDHLRHRVFETGEMLALGSTFGENEDLTELQAAGGKDAIIVPLRTGSAVIGTLEVAGRLGDTVTFLPGDVKLLEAVAAHAAVAVENSRLVDRLRYDAYHDALTGLPNRRRVTTALEESVKVRAPGEVVAVLFFDVDSLRDVNDSLGYAAGDRLIGEVATRLRSAAAAGALVGRVGGDEFVVTLRIPSAEAATSLATSLRKQLQQPLSFGTLTLDVDTAVGIVVHPDHGTDPATLLQRAELATHAAKSSANGVQLFSLGMESRSVRRLGLAGDLRRALDNNELEVYFQPKVDLRDRHLVGVECLARWEHPTHGSVAPEDFVAVAEHTGQLSRLTEAVLREGLRRAREWIDAGRPLGVAVNLSARTLLDTEFPNRVDEILREYAVSPDRLTLEITEDGFVGEEDRPLPTLRRLYELGVRLSVDDFGTGYSSLSYLRRLPVHEVKIDRSFVQGMATDAGDLAIVRAVVDISRHFGLAVVAEGVESELTLDLLAEIGCDIGQGFLFSRPLPYERLEAWLGARTDGEPTPGGEVRRLRAVG